MADGGQRCDLPTARSLRSRPFSPPAFQEPSGCLLAVVVPPPFPCSLLTTSLKYITMIRLCGRSRSLLVEPEMHLLILRPCVLSFQWLLDEIIQIILNELDDPSSFSILSKRFHQFTQDPYVRSSYFISRYGRIQALFFAMGRGKLINERVIDVWISTGILSLEVNTGVANHLPVSDYAFQWRPPFPLPRTVRYTPLLSGPGAIHQDSVGPHRASPYLHAFHDGGRAYVW